MNPKRKQRLYLTLFLLLGSGWGYCFADSDFWRKHEHVLPAG
jgi:hypothetical protein